MRKRSSIIVDAGFRLAYRLAYPVFDRWWHFRQNHDGAVIAVWLNDRVLAVRHSYKRGLRLPAGGLGRGEDHRHAAVRELREEVGVSVDPAQLDLICSIRSRHGPLHFYETCVETMPELLIDYREIIEAKFVPPDTVCEPDRNIAAYLRLRT